MQDLSVPPSAAGPLLAAIAAVSEHPTHPRTRRLIDFVAAELHAGATPDAIAPSPGALALEIPAHAREAAVQRLVLAAMLVPPLTAARLELLTHHAVALGRAREPALRDLRRLVRGRHRLLALGLMPRFPPSERLKAAWRRGGVGGRWRFVKALAKLGDAGTAARYQALAGLPEGTLGRGFFDHCRANAFALPGERGALPEAAVFHDMGHVLVGAGTDVAGETRMAGFEAGCMGERGFTMLEFTLLLFNLGAKLPAAAEPAVGEVDTDTLLTAYTAGRRSNLDVLAWDPWPDTDRPLGELRARYGIT